MSHEPIIILLIPNSTDAELIEMQIRKANVHGAMKRVTSKEAFVKILADIKPDLVVADNAVPRFDGAAALKLGREVAPNVPWIMFCSTATEETMVEYMQAGAVDVVTKRNYTRVGQAVRRALELPAHQPVQAALPPPAAQQEPNPDVAVILQAVNNMRDLVAVVDLEGRRLYNSPSYMELLEEPETLRGTDSFVDIHPEDRAMVKSVFAETVRTGRGQRMEYRLMDKDGITRYIESHGSVITGPGGEPSRVVIVSRDVTRRNLLEEASNQLSTATAGVTGDLFFRELVRGLAALFGVRYALVSECTDARCDRVRALAYWADGNWQPQFAYDVAGTTCEQVIKQAVPCYYRAHVQELFPRETALVAMQAHSYLGVPLLAQGGAGVAGHLFIMDDKPMADPAYATAVLTVYALRASMELSRHHAQATQLRSRTTRN